MAFYQGPSVSGPSVEYSDLTLERALKLSDDPEVQETLHRLSDRVFSILAEQTRFRDWCIRADELYYANEFTAGGADLWPFDPSATTPGRAHVSINTPPVYVDVPAALQAVEPIENMVATTNTDDARDAAAGLERVYTAWKVTDGFDTKFAKACTVKALYGRTAGKVYWDKDATPPRPVVEIVEQPRNLYMGYKSDKYDQLEWAAYVERTEPQSVVEEFGVDVVATDFAGTVMPLVVIPTTLTIPSRPWLTWGPARIEVWDFWYRQPVWRKGKFVKMETWNVVIAGNAVVRGPNMYPEYDGEIPYVPLFNTYIPGVPGGRAELYDMEPLIREKFEKFTAGSQMISSGVAGDYWQLVGAEAPSRVPESLKPVRNKVIGPGAGNRIETITPFVAEFQLEQFLGRLDREQAIVSGLNDLLLGLAPASVLSSSKAVNALIANYESRLSMRRILLYNWRRDLWSLVVKVWVKKNATLAKLISKGGGWLDVISPSLNPRDELETTTRAANLVGAKLWSQRRAMDAVGVDDPETEMDMIREERTDATLWPQDVMVMAQLMGALKNLGLQAPQGVQGQEQKQLASGQNALSTALGAGQADNTNSSQLPGDQGLMPPEGVPPGGTPAASAPFAQGPQPPAAPPSTGALQGILAQSGNGPIKVQNKLKTQAQLGRR